MWSEDFAEVDSNSEWHREELGRRRPTVDGIDDVDDEDGIAMEDAARESDLTVYDDNAPAAESAGLTPEPDADDPEDDSDTEDEDLSPRG